MRKLLWLFGFGLALFAGSPSSLQAEIKTKEISYTHDGEPMKGFLAWDDSISEPRPGILLVHEWWGLNDYVKTRTRQLAELGYVAFALDMYGEGRVTEHPTVAADWSGTVRTNVQKWRARALAGLDVLKSQPGVDAENLAAIGYCFGGSTVIQMAYVDAPVKGVVSFHGALVPPPADVKFRPKVAVFHGGADSFVPAATVNAFEFGMEQANANYFVMTLGGARHGFTNPNAGDYGIDALKYDPQADKLSWEMMQIFFKELFSKP